MFNVNPQFKVISYSSLAASVMTQLGLLVQQTVA